MQQTYCNYDRFYCILSVSEHLNVFVWVPEFSINCSILNMFWNFNWNKIPGMKRTWLSFFFQFLHKLWQKCLAKAHGVLLLLPPLHNKVDEKLWRYKSQWGSGTSNTERTVWLRQHSARTSLCLSPHWKLNFDRQRKAGEQQQISVCLLSACASCFALQLEFYSQKGN